MAIVIAMTLPIFAIAGDIEFSAGKVWGFYQSVKVLNTECSKSNTANWNELSVSVERWLERNNPTVETAIKASMDAFLRSSPNGANNPLALDIWQSAISATERQLTLKLTQEIQRDPHQFCEIRARILASGRAELADLFPNELKSIPDTLR
ncbi:MAG: hypothetical protein EG825_14445 [Rhodocyclaceae bacterium]|nr:hypothetical protein [Rhodocyclaceae bacterium]